MANILYFVSVRCQPYNWITPLMTLTRSPVRHDSEFAYKSGFRGMKITSPVETW